MAVDHNMIHSRISAWGQVRIYLGKCFRLFRYEKQWKLFISAGIIAGLVCMVTGPNMFCTYEATNKGSFAIICACIWSGLFNSIRSVCRERDIIKREHRTGLRLSSYIMAHTIYEVFLCAVESLIVLLLVIMRNITHLPERGIVFPHVLDIYITLFLVTLGADLLALLVSCIVKDENSAMMIMPFILVVQLVFSGVVFELNGFLNGVSYITVSRWGVDGMCSIAQTDTMIDLEASFMDATSEASAQHLLIVWGILIFYCIAYVLISMLVLRLVDKDER